MSAVAEADVPIGAGLWGEEGDRGTRKGRENMVREGEGILREKIAPEWERSTGQVSLRKLSQSQSR
jgi:hypothetical protein